MESIHVQYGISTLEQAGDVIVQFIHVQSFHTGSDKAVHAQLDRVIRDYEQRGLFHVKQGSILTLPTLGLLSAPEVIFVALDTEDDVLQHLREAMASVARERTRLKAKVVLTLLPPWLNQVFELHGFTSVAQAMTEGYMLGSYRRVKAQPANVGTSDTRPSLETQLIIVPAASYEQSYDDACSQWQRGSERGQVIARGVIESRRLTNLPGNELTPEQLALEAERLAETFSDELGIEIIDEYTAFELGMGGLLGVGQGSAHPPRMIVLDYIGDPGADEKWAIIGKGITFDTGGISLKKAAGMEEMISDMAGAAAVLGAMQAIAALKPTLNVIAVIPTAENMPSDRALKPGDVIRMMNGTTVEITNTDAEGRLVLADALTTALQRGATKLVDVATLTGAVMVSLSDIATGAIGNDQRLLGQVIAASERVGERIWPLPNYPEFRKMLDSDAAQLRNSTGSRYGGASTGGLFIGEFAEGVPWVHLDIGGTAWLTKARGVNNQGATGVMVRTLVELLLSQASK